MAHTGLAARMYVQTHGARRDMRLLSHLYTHIYSHAYTEANETWIKPRTKSLRDRAHPPTLPARLKTRDKLQAEETQNKLSTALNAWTCTCAYVRQANIKT